MYYLSLIFHVSLHNDANGVMFCENMPVNLLNFYFQLQSRSREILVYTFLITLTFDAKLPIKFQCDTIISL